jgi:plasmid stabilization system protein ParE
MHDFIAHDSGHYAKKVVQDIADKTDVLAELPRKGRVVPELGNENIWELSMYSYRILYEIKEQHAYILAIIHKRQNLQLERIE